MSFFPDFVRAAKILENKLTRSLDGLDGKLEIGVQVEINPEESLGVLKKMQKAVRRHGRSFLRGEAPFQPARYFFGMVAIGPRLPFINYRPFLVDDVKPLRPTGVEFIRPIIHSINRERERIVESAGKIL